MADLKMPDINSVIIAGNLTKDPTLRTTTNGTSVANFPIAYSRKFKDNAGNWREEVCYVGVVAWYRLAESCYENIFKGSAVMIEGELQSKSWKMDNGYFRSVVEIKAKRIQFLNKKSNTVVIEDKSQESCDDITDNMYDAAPLEADKADIDSPGSNVHDDSPDPGEPPDQVKSYPGYDNLTL